MTFPLNRPLRILLSASARQALAPAVAEVLGTHPHELVTVDEAPATGVDAAFISRDVTGLSTKHVLTDDTRAFYDTLRRSSELQWLHIHSAGADRPIYTELRARGVQVSTSSGANAEVVAQTALAGVLALARRFPQLMAAQQAHTWAPLIGQTPPRDLAGQTAVIVGWGPIGQRIGAVLRLLGLKLIVVRRHAARGVEEGVEMVDFAAFQHVLPRADWLLLACPLTEQTRALVNRQALAALPHGANLINVARGEVVVERELIEALREGRLGGAYLDVFEHEPLAADSPLWALPGVIVTPHSAGHSDGNERRVAEIFLANLTRWQSGQSLQHCIA
ncbi:MAG: D-2-hydroxyacid dehydrogenase [Gammaproteobacteria bacterium]|nr:D-2-hydroxyacid dehydrogenase [Gammaproteobacteria bacterium]MBU0787387.1 D-2-hydroxyacid dehydrogenase [Gammaproteobacteria bacterium]MBU0816472.1 D-2-hydroxyacid dehydrogenase [Gammaproteobacteria bacterium]MBU1787666.1 D-2-hydroxyacid dehydrogenase [Gammaproteobacteria bacterium]